ncbi:hypothetical protein AXF42_Ash003248 [Apostasia shenzhenica]|uniref:Uncharacterized protein n=1 Tax=Apostasia shenzhenica TaxID=1088818 RepID=A0A2I0BFP5_9ASPA|nr:hypothetical protein AXF42_Ash003248 [Apostasia shenzhenica]
MWGIPRNIKEKESSGRRRRAKGVSLLIKAQGGNQFRAFKETHRDLRWFRDEIPYVHRSISEEGFTNGKKVALKACTVLLGRKEEEEEKELLSWGSVTKK